MPTFFAGAPLAASDLNLLSAQIDSLTAPGWVDYSGTFTLTSSGTNPTKGNSTYKALYRRPAGADLIDVKILVIIGTSFVVGTGDYRFSLPFNAHADELTGGVGELYHLDASPGTNHAGICYPAAAGYLSCIDDGVANFLGAANPVVPAVNDTYRLFYSYRPA